ncbi:hypothetical protein MF1_09000 [Bartonella quintana]|nr:hypothetical protein MF1_09000 [Bartonella quintana]
MDEEKVKLIVNGRQILLHNPRVKEPMKLLLALEIVKGNRTLFLTYWPVVFCFIKLWVVWDKIFHKKPVA